LLNLNIALAAVLATGLPFVAFSRLVLYHFYSKGAFLLDTGLLASLLWHSNLALALPTSLGGGSYLATHVSPLFWLASAISRLLPFSMPQFFAGFIGFSHALLAAAIFWLLTEGYGLRRGAGPWLATFVAIGFASSGLAIAIALYPHFETLIAAFFLLFAVAHALGHTRIAPFLFVLGLMTREDAGLHYIAILGLLVALNVAYRVPLRQQRPELIYVVVALVYVIFVMSVQHLAFPGNSAFARVYLGDPPFAHLSVRLIADRARLLVVERPYIVLPACGAFIWAWFGRNPYLVLGYVACVPWLMLNLLANNPFAGMIIGYYAFPVLIALAWPLLALLHPRPEHTFGHGTAIAGFVALLAVSYVPAALIYNPGRLHFIQAVLGSPTLAQQSATERAVAAISAARPALGRLLADNSVVAIAPNDFTRAEMLDFTGVMPDEIARSPDTVAFFADGYDAMRLRAVANSAKLLRRYTVPGTSISLASRRDLEQVPALAGLLAVSRR